MKQLENIPELKFLASECNKGELAAFIAFAIALPTNYLALVDTYNVLKWFLIHLKKQDILIIVFVIIKRSGIPNFCAVALALNELGYHAKGILEY